MKKIALLVAPFIASTMLLSSCSLFSIGSLDSSASATLPPSSTTGSENSSTSSSSSSSSSSSIVEEEHSVPEYRGMTIHRDPAIAKQATLDFSYVQSQGFSANGKEDLSDLVDYPVEQTEEVRYFVEPGEWFYLNIYLSNPDSYEIQSFTLNGQKYANYMFEEGSTLDKIVLHLQATTDPGYFTFHIQEMKYIDNNEIRDVVMNTNTTIYVGVPYDEQPTCLATTQIYSDGAQFELQIQDPQNLAKDYPIYFYLSDGSKILRQEQLSLGRNEVDVQDLNVQQTYQYGVITAFDQADGRYDHSEWLVKETFTTKPPVAFSYLTAKESSVEFALHTDADYMTQVKEIRLYDGLDVVKQFSPSLGQEIFRIDGLLSNHNYGLEIRYEYFRDGETFADVHKMYFRTLENHVPEASFEVYGKTHTSLSFRLNVRDEDNVFSLGEVILSNESGEIAVVKERKDIYTFDDLLSGHAYFIKATYYYNLNDETGTKRGETASFSATTLSFDAPTVVEKEVIMDETGFSVSYAMNGDGESGIDSLVLLKDGQEIQTIEGSSATFKDLSTETAYDVQVFYHYDLMDGKGVRKDNAVFSYKTYPKFEITEFRIENDQFIQYGETLFISILLRNERRLEVTRVRINGTDYAVNLLSTPERLLIQIINDGSLGGGEISFRLEGIYFMKDGQENFLGTNMETSIFFINGNMELLDAVIVDENLKKRNYAFPDEKLYVLLTFQNDSEYEITAIDEKPVSELPITKLDDTHYLYALSQTPGESNYFFIDKIQYRNIYVESVMDVNVNLSYITLADDTIVEIDSVEDLQDVDDFHYYRLTKDLNLAGKDFEATAMNGYFDGGNHTISNLKLFREMKGSTRLGLFTYATGVISSLHLNNFFFNISFNNDDHDRMGLAFLAGEGKNLTVKDCSIDNNSILILKSDVIYSFAVGGFLGLARGSVSIHDCVNSGNISGERYIGGFIGTAIEDNGIGYEIDIRRCVNNGTITGESYVSGFFGTIDWAGTVHMEDVLNTGDISAESKIQQSDARAGAFSSTMYYSCNVYMTNAVNVGDIDFLISEYSGLLYMKDCLNLVPGSRLVDYSKGDTNQHKLITQRCYALESIEQEIACTKEQILNPAFYDTLGFSRDLWQFDFVGEEEKEVVISLNIPSLRH